LLDHSPFFLGWSSHIFPFKSSFLKRNFPAMDDRRVPQLHPVALSWPRGVTFFFLPPLLLVAQTSLMTDVAGIVW
jgi:hypothetical protein